MKKMTIFAVSILIIVCSSIVLIKLLTKDSREPNIEVESIEEIRYRKLESALRSSKDFEHSKLMPNETKESLTVDDKYTISIKNNAYKMTIKDSKLEKDYCKLVDIIEMSLGHAENASITTCEETLQGAISMKGLDVDIYDDYKVLSIDSEEPITIYNIDATHHEKESISVDEIDYNIEIEDFLFTSVVPKYEDSSKTYKICGNVYNRKNKKSESFALTLYSSSNEILQIKNYTYENDTKKYLSFCVDFPLEQNTIKYYSIERSTT